MDQSEVIDELLSVGTRRELSDGEILCHQGDVSDSAFVVISGRLVTEVQVTDDGTQDTVAMATHGPGALVGEVTALAGGRRTATLRADGPVSVAEVSARDLRRTFDDHPGVEVAVTTAARDRTDRSRVAALLAAELGATDRAAIADIAASVTWQHLEAGETLFNAGDPADAAFIVLQGRVRIISPDGRQVAEVGRGSVVGEYGLLEGRGRTATVVARRQTSLARLDRRDFTAMTATHTNLAMGLVRRIIDRAGQEISALPQLGRSACIVTTSDLDWRAIVDSLTAALEPSGPTIVLTPERVDAMLGSDGACDVAPGQIGDVRLAELLHQVEVDHHNVVLIGDLNHPQWTKTTLSRVDQVVIMSSGRPTSMQSEQIQAISAMIPDGTPTWLAVDHASPLRGLDCHHDLEPGTTPGLLDRFDVDEVHHFTASDQADLGRIARLALGRGVGLALSGGGARGFAHLGAARALEESGIPVDRIAGASMGALIGSGLARRVLPERRVPLLQTELEGFFDYTLPLVSVLKGRRATEAISRYTAGRDITDLWVPFVGVATNLTTAEVVAMRRGPLNVAIRASVSIPGLLPPVPMGDDLLVDGGVLNNLPVDLLASDPSVGTVIAVDVAPPRGPSSPGDYGLAVSGWSVIASRLRPKSRSGRRRYPALSPTLMRTMLIGAARDREIALQSGMVDLYLDLDLRGVGLLDFDRVAEVADLGYEAAKERVEAWAAANGWAAATTAR